jgi:thiol-disulfide isomerase/thioredoxin
MLLLLAGNKKFFIVFSFLFLVGIYSCSEKRKQAAQVNGEVIFVDEVDAVIESQLYYYLLEIYESRKIALNALIESKILSLEARKRGMSYHVFLDSLYNIEIHNSAPKKNQLTFVQDSSGKFDISYEQGRQYILKKQESELRKRWADSLSNFYKVEINLKRPEKVFLLDMQDVKCYYKNGAGLPLTIWLISDFDCFSCRELQPMFESTLEKYSDKVNFAYVFYSGMVSRASIAAECADRQGKFWEMKNMLNDDLTKDITKYIKFANEIGMDTIRFKNDFDDPDTYHMISNNLDILSKKGIFATPSIVIGKRMYFNIQNEKELSNLIDSHLKNK